jgi:hypothetical protein
MVRPKGNPNEIRDIMMSFRASAGMKAAVDIAAGSRSMTNTEWLLEAVQNSLNAHAARQNGSRPE